MDLFQLVLLAIIQGISEFLPISSSGHLLLVPILTGWGYQGLAFDVATHVGTLGAVLILFRKDVAALFRGIWSLVRARIDADARLLLMLALGTVPVGVVGLIRAFLFAELFDPDVSGQRLVGTVVACSLMLWGVVLWVVDGRAAERRDLSDVGFRDVLLVGLAQSLALIPGTSRSGITMIAARALGLERVAAARLSFLLSIPAIGLSGAVVGLDVMTGDGALAAQGVSMGDITLGAGVACLAGIATVVFLLRFVQRFSFRPFAMYRVLLGAGLLALVWLATG